MNLTTNRLGELIMMMNPTVKECRECGCKFEEKQESFLYECERCICSHDD
jgi:hypothetical protein